MDTFQIQLLITKCIHRSIFYCLTMFALKLWLLFLIILSVYLLLNLDKIQSKTELSNPFPMRSQHQKVLIVTRWKSGSTYFGEILALYPKTYYTYEPLHVLTNKVISSSLLIHLHSHLFFFTGKQFCSHEY